MSIRDAIAARMKAIEASFLDGTPPVPRPSTVAEAIAQRLQAVAESFTPPAPPPVAIAAHTMPARLHIPGGEVVFE